jgi:histidyl-tRNA synthetase
MLVESVPPPPRPIAVIPAGDGAEAKALETAQELRRAGFVVDIGFSGNLGKRMKRANKLGARAAVILGENELSRNAATVRDLDSGEESEIPLAALKDRLGIFR